MKHKNINPFKHIINVDLIESYMIVNDLSKEEFCKKAKIDMELLEDILHRRLTWFPYAIWEMADNIGIHLGKIMNADIVTKYKITLFENDVFRI